jgi:hypothetical protein
MNLDDSIVPPTIELDTFFFSSINLLAVGISPISSLSGQQQFPLNFL